jgi:hypothetical protein
MKKLSFVVATVLVVFGLFAALLGISEDREKVFILGLVLIFASGVFATLPEHPRANLNQNRVHNGRAR